MYNIEFTTSDYEFDFEYTEYLKCNYQFANIFFAKDYVTAFTFPSYLQSTTLYLQKFLIDPATQELSLDGSAILISNTYKHTGYYESYIPSPNLNPGYYYITSDALGVPIYVSKNIIKVGKASFDDDDNSGLIDGGEPFADVNGDQFEDVSNEILIAKIKL